MSEVNRTLPKLLDFYEELSLRETALKKKVWELLPFLSLAILLLLRRLLQQYIA